MSDQPPSITSDSASVSDFFSACMGSTFIEGNQVRVLRNGDAIFPAMLDAIDQAQDNIEFLTFVYWQGEIAIEFARHLAQAAQRGVVVRVLLDSFGAASMDRQARQLLTKNCQLRWFRPLRTVRFWQNFKRTHRKIMVCDGQLAFTGGVGIAQQWTGNADKPENWRETHFSVRGPAVTPIRAAFLENWLEAGPDDASLFTLVADNPQPGCGEQAIMVVASTASDYWSSAGTLLLTAIHAAEHSLRISTPYFVPDNNLQNNLIAAQQRGVNIEIIIPEASRSDSKLAALAAHGSLARLVSHGIRIHAYQPTLIHTKCILVDEQIAIVGSINFNQRSQRKDDEISLLLKQGEAMQTLLQDFNHDLQQSIEFNQRNLRKRPALLTTAARLIQPFRRNL